MESVEHLRIVKKMMVLSGTWRIKLDSKSEMLQKIYDLFSVCIQLYFTLFVISLIIELSFIWNQNIQKVIENLGVTILCLIMLMKIRICQSKRIVDLVQILIKSEKLTLESDDLEVKKIYIAHAKATNKVSVLLILYTYGCVGFPLIIFNLINYFQVENMHKHDFNSTHEKAPLPYVSWFPFDSNKYYFIAFGLDAIAAYLGSTYNVVTQMFFFALMIYVIGQLKILQLYFRNFHSYSKKISSGVHSDDQMALWTLRNFILEHRSLIGYLEELDESMKYLMLLEFLMNSFDVASIVFQLLTARPNVLLLFTVLYIGMIVQQIFLLAWFANEVKQQSLGLADALYESQWYMYNEKVKKCILIMLMRSQRPLELHIGPFYPMTTSTALATMKAAYSYVTILNR